MFGGLGVGCWVFFFFFIRMFVFWFVLLCSVLFICSINTNSHFPSSWMAQAGTVFVAGIYLFRTQMSSESLRWNVCEHRPDLETVLGSGVKTMLTSRKKSPQPTDTEERRTRDASSRRTANPTYYQLSYSGPEGSVRGRFIKHGLQWMRAFLEAHNAIICWSWKDIRQRPQILSEWMTFFLFVICYRCLFHEKIDRPLVQFLALFLSCHSLALCLQREQAALKTQRERD